MANGQIESSEDDDDEEDEDDDDSDDEETRKKVKTKEGICDSSFLCLILNITLILL